MENQNRISSLQNLVMKAEMIKIYNPKNIEDILNALKELPELQTSKTKELLKYSVTEKNWINLKYNLIDEMVKKIGDIYYA
ncbi:hypothetical protein [Pedobacter jamesrossensis]|uniref:Uncharacterized protein n=1 Tax=Pedobacter jamesrossensis TaxID=1908238 RepID=A0ABV8NHP6_9SPHI